MSEVQSPDDGSMFADSAAECSTLRTLVTRGGVCERALHERINRVGDSGCVRQTRWLSG